MSAVDVKLKTPRGAWSAGEERWEVLVEVLFTNLGSETFELDKATACEGGRLSNAVFVVKGEREELQYRGMMRKRAHPGRGGFFKIKSGKTHSVQVDLGEHYEFPPTGGSFELSFDHFNHFSKDAVQLVSSPVSLRLER